MVKKGKYKYFSTVQKYYFDVHVHEYINLIWISIFYIAEGKSWLH